MAGAEFVAEATLPVALLHAPTHSAVAAVGVATLAEPPSPAEDPTAPRTREAAPVSAHDTASPKQHRPPLQPPVPPPVYLDAQDLSAALDMADMSEGGIPIPHGQQSARNGATTKEGGAEVAGANSLGVVHPDSEAAEELLLGIASKQNKGRDSNRIRTLEDFKRLRSGTPELAGMGKSRDEATQVGVLCGRSEALALLDAAEMPGPERDLVAEVIAQRAGVKLCGFCTGSPLLDATLGPTVSTLAYVVLITGSFVRDFVAQKQTTNPAFNLRAFLETRPDGVRMSDPGHFPDGVENVRPRDYTMSTDGVTVAPAWKLGRAPSRKRPRVWVLMQIFNSNTDVHQSDNEDLRFQTGRGVAGFSCSTSFANSFYASFLQTLFRAILPSFKEQDLIMLGVLGLLTYHKAKPQKVHRDTRDGLNLIIAEELKGVSTSAGGSSSDASDDDDSASDAVYDDESVDDGPCSMKLERTEGGIFVMSAPKNHDLPREAPPGFEACYTESLLSLNIVPNDRDGDIAVEQAEFYGLNMGRFRKNRTSMLWLYQHREKKWRTFPTENKYLDNLITHQVKRTETLMVAANAVHGGSSHAQGGVWVGGEEKIPVFWEVLARLEPRENLPACVKKWAGTVRMRMHVTGARNGPGVRLGLAPCVSKTYSVDVASKGFKKKPTYVDLRRLDYRPQSKGERKIVGETEASFGPEVEAKDLEMAVEPLEEEIVDSDQDSDQN